MTSPDTTDIQRYLDEHPDLATLEILSPDMSGILRAKRIPRDEVSTFFSSGVTGPGTTSLMNTLGDPGKYQSFLYFLLWLCNSTVAMNHLIMTVFGAAPPHR